MKREQQEKNRRGFWQGRGFYMILALCLIAVGGLGVVTLTETFSLGGSSGSSAPTTAAEAGRTLETVPDVRTTRKATTTEPSVMTTAPTAPPTAPPVSEPAENLMILPLSNAVLTPYSLTPLYSATLESWKIHPGTDFAGELGQEVRALTDGTVQKVYSDPLWGECLVLDHGNGVQSLYCGVHAVCVEGDTVKVGEKIGTLTEIPCECRMAPHLHLELRRGGETLDPVEAIGLEVRYS